MENFENKTNLPKSELINPLVLAMPAVVALLVGCAEKPSIDDIERVIQEGGYTEKISAEDLEAIKSNISTLRQLYREQNYVTVRDNNGNHVGIHFPEENILVIAPERAGGSFETASRDASYTFQPDGTIVMNTGLNLEGVNPSTESKTIIQESSLGPIVSYSRMNDFGPRREYTIGQDKHQMTPVARNLDRYIQLHRQIIDKAITEAR